MKYYRITADFEVSLLHETGEDKGAVFFVASEFVTLLSVRLPVKDRKTIAQALPSVLEDALFSEIETLHVVFDLRRDLPYPIRVAVMDKAVFESSVKAALSVLPEGGGFAGLYPDLWLLPRMHPSSLLLSEDRALLLHEGDSGFSVSRAVFEAATLPSLLSSSAAEALVSEEDSDVAPLVHRLNLSDLAVYGPSAESLPEALRPLYQGELPGPQVPPGPLPLNLLSGSPYLQSGFKTAFGRFFQKALSLREVSLGGPISQLKGLLFSPAPKVLVFLAAVYGLLQLPGAAESLVYRAQARQEMQLTLASVLSSSKADQGAGLFALLDKEPFTPSLLSYRNRLYHAHQAQARSPWAVLTLLSRYLSPICETSCKISSISLSHNVAEIEFQTSRNLSLEINGLTSLLNTPYQNTHTRFTIEQQNGYDGTLWSYHLWIRPTPEGAHASSS